MATRKRSTGPTIELNVKTLAWLASLIAVLYGLNRPVQAFNALSASVDKLASAVERIDLTQGEQTKALDSMKEQSAGLTATVTQQGEHLTALEARLAAVEAARH